MQFNLLFTVLSDVKGWSSKICLYVNICPDFSTMAVVAFYIDHYVLMLTETNDQSIFVWRQV